jgi:phosphate transport system ATP-binding protein
MGDCDFIGSIEAKNCNLFYGDFKALKNINIVIPSRKITALIGPSGCGKSTFLKIFNRMDELVPNCHIEGDFRIGDVNIFDKKVDINLLRKNVGMVFQKPNPFPMSIYDNVAFAPRTFGVKRGKALDEIVINSLKKASIYDEVKDRLKENALGLSGGQQQRLCIARALSASPKVLLMDEPTSALDPISTAKIEELVLALKKEITIIIVTHNMQQATRIADKTAFFLLGELVEYDKTENIFMHPKDSRTLNYVTGRFG